MKNENDLESLIKDLVRKTPKQYNNLVMDSVSWIQKFHAGHRRLSGENYVFHALRVANIAADFNLDTDSVIAALLHSVLYRARGKDLEKILNKIDNIFGGDVYKLLKMLEKINEGTDSEETDREIITRYILNNAEDIRPILIKLADVLDDVRHIEYLSDEQIKTKATKVFDIYGPLASYLNLEEVRKEIEETAFKYRRNEDYEFIKQKMEDEGLNEELLNKYIEKLDMLTSNILDYKPKIFGRIKNKYSVYKKLKKMENEGRNTKISDINDRLALSIITQDKEDCFLIKMLLEEKAYIDERETDDYITNPKPNGFQALQVSAIFEDISYLFVEIQILTYRMYYINKYGPASHLAYKASKSRFATPTNSYDWLKQLHRKIMRSKYLRKQVRSVPIKADIFNENIYIFTPKDKIIELPKNATALDFAYRIHTNVGHRATYAEVDGKTQGLDAVLRTGQVVKIITSEEKKYPKKEWLEFVVSPSTKDKIRRGLREKMVAYTSNSSSSTKL